MQGLHEEGGAVVELATYRGAFGAEGMQVQRLKGNEQIFRYRGAGAGGVVQWCRGGAEV